MPKKQHTVAQRSPSDDSVDSFRVDRTNETLRELTVRSLRNAILTGHFQPGERLVEKKLCEMTGVSRTSIREALRHLESEGLIETIPHRGPVVYTLTLEDAREIYEVRSALERLAIRRFVERAKDSDISALAKAAQRYVRAAKANEINPRLEATRDFYNIIFEGCGNRVATSMFQSLLARMQHLRASTIPRQTESDTAKSIRNYLAIVEACRKRDAKTAASACERHIRHVSRVALQILRDRPSASVGQG